MKELVSRYSLAGSGLETGDVEPVKPAANRRCKVKRRIGGEYRASIIELHDLTRDSLYFGAWRSEDSAKINATPARPPIRDAHRFLRQLDAQALKSNCRHWQPRLYAIASARAGDEGQVIWWAWFDMT